MPTVHNVLQAARTALGLAPEAPAHGGAPLPLLYNATYMELVLWIADRVAPKLPEAVRAKHDAIVAAARGVRAPEQLSKKDRAVLTGCIARTGAYGAWEVDPASPIVVAQGVALDACECDVNANCGKGTRAAAVAAAKLLGPSFLEALDAEIVRLDAVTMLQKQEIDPGARVEATLWRGATGAKTTHWIVKLDDGRFGLLSKVKGKWRWHEGARDDVLATVPEAHMKEAFAAVLGGAPPARAKPEVAAEVLPLEGGILAGVALGPDGTAWAVTREGELAELDHGSWRRFRAKVGRVDGISAEAGRRVLTWGKQITLWTDGEPRVVKARPAQPPAPARFERGDKHRTVSIGSGPTLELDKGNIERVVVTGERVLVGYHAGKRVAAFGLDGVQQKRVDARDLGAGFDFVFPLARGGGMVLGFAPHPRGDVLLCDLDAHALGAWKLGRFYVGGKSYLAERDGKVLFGHATTHSVLLLIS